MDGAITLKTRASFISSCPTIATKGKETPVRPYGLFALSARRLFIGQVFGSDFPGNVFFGVLAGLYLLDSLF